MVVFDAPPEAQEHHAAKVDADQRLHGHHHHRHKRAFYVPARRLLAWGEVQRTMHASWGDLFYDLIAVAAVYKVGSYFKTNLYSTGPLGLVGMGITVLNTWSHALQYRCRFEGKSLAHKLVDALDGLTAAAAAQQISDDALAFEKQRVRIFVTMVLFNRAVQAARRLELVLQPTAQKDLRDASARYAALEMLARILIEMSTLSVAYALGSTEHVMFVLIGTWILQVALSVVPALRVRVPTPTPAPAPVDGH
jgi:hypothetical protein